MEYSIIDSQMVSENYNDLVKIANANGYRYYSEMLYDMHCNERKPPREISEMLYDKDGNLLASKEGIYYTLNKYGWLIKNIKHNKTKIPNHVKMCICCGRVPKHKDLHMLCMTCYKANGHNVKGAQGGNYDPHLEYSHGATMTDWGQR